MRHGEIFKQQEPTLGRKGWGVGRSVGFLIPGKVRTEQGRSSQNLARPHIIHKIKGMRIFSS